MANTLTIKSKLALFGSVLASSLLLVSSAQAVSISPLNFELNGNPGDKLSNVVRIYNDLNSEINVKMEVQDFVAAGENGEVLIKEGENTSYSLAKWVTLLPETFTIPAQSSQMVEFTVRIPADAEPGGHYGSVLATISGSSSGNGVGINMKVGSLLLLDVAGQVSENLGVSDFQAPAFSENGPDSLSARFTNDGTVHLKPRGFVLVKNMFGTEVAKIDLPQLNVLPQSTRKVDIPLKLDNQFGRYEATLAAIYGAANEPISAVTVYWVIPYKLLAVYGGILLVLLIFAIRGRKRLKAAFRVLFKGETS